MANLSEAVSISVARPQERRDVNALSTCRSLTDPLCELPDLLIAMFSLLHTFPDLVGGVDHS